MTRVFAIASALLLNGLACWPLAAQAADAGSAPTVTHPPGSRYVVGKPYQFDGVWYRPGINYDYDATGIAVVYDPSFAGERTTDGEIYDDQAPSAAHKTLPLPSLVLVTDLDNGRQVVVRVNDRGPFVDNQVIALSGGAAAALGIPRAGQAHVRVQILAPESRALAAAYGADSAAPAETAPRLAAMPAPQVKVEPLAGQPQQPPRPSQPAAPAASHPAAALATTAAAAAPAPSAQAVELLPPPLPKPALSEAAAAPPNPPPNPTATQTAALPPVPAAQTPMAPAPATTTEHRDADPLIAHAAGYFVQTGVFTDPAAAERLRSRLAALGQAKVVTVPAGALSFTAVMLGPIASLAEAKRMLAQVAALGYKDAVLIAQ